MKKPLLTALSPNAQADDIWLALKLCFQPWRWRTGKTTDQFKAIFKGWLSSPYVFLFESGRTSLYALLTALELRSEDEVLIQSYTCVAVPEPVLWVKAKPVYVDCEEENFTMSLQDLEKKITAKSKVLIIQHTFGQPAQLDELLAVARKHHLFVIEDCAHALGAIYHGEKVGTFGDASFFSFGRDKVISSVFGGALSVKDPKLARKIENVYNSCRPADRDWILQQLLHPVIMGIVKSTYVIYLGKILLWLSKRLGILSKAVYREERNGERPPFLLRKFPNALAVLALHQFEKLDHFNAHRQELAERYREVLEGLPLLFPGDFSANRKTINDSQSIFLRYTIRTKKARALMAAARKEEIYLGDWYMNAIAPEDVNYKKIGYDPLTCPVAEKMALETVNFPTDIHISDQAFQRITTFVQKFYAS